ncbi:MAG TPA: HlyD family efflux transporter periplasmic adaptor subunit [Steroidobacteraceae bacterium]|nr:HlyD family efflux transporter periplasmic adaptor subunit [Steroidobacteraceae bacterium]
MDIPRPENKRKRRIRQAGIGIGAVVLAVLATVGLARLEPAAPSVARASVWVDTVREGEMLRQVRGPGTLVPREIRWIAAQTDGRVERIVVRPGAVVGPDTVILEMSNPDLMQQAEEARYALEAAEAEFTDTELNLRSQQLDQRAAHAVARAEYESARLQAEAEKTLSEQGIVSTLQHRRSELLAEQLKVRLEIESDRAQQFATSVEARLAAQRARLEQVRNAYERRLEQIASLSVKAGISGVLQQVPVEEGQRVTLGANIARVARPEELMAELRIAETQARDVQVGQHVAIDTRNGIVEGRVVRIDPAVQAGTVQVDVDLTGELPRGARPDLSVDGTIEIERLPSVVYAGRPAYGQPNSTVSLFKLVDGGASAVRVSVQLGRSSVNAIEIIQGLEPGEQLILSDTSAWDEYDRIRLN